MGKWVDGKMGRWENGKMGKWVNVSCPEIALHKN
jgi:hypothetical protein